MITQDNYLNTILSRSSPSSTTENGYEIHELTLNNSIVCKITAKWLYDEFQNDYYLFSNYHINNIEFIY
jgi:hypothetical protein